MIFIFVSLAFFFIVQSQATVASQPYGHGVYGECGYEQGCPDAPPPMTVVPVPPSPGNPQPGRAIGVNITDGQQFTGDEYEIIVSPNFASDQIEYIAIILDGQEIGRITTATSGAYSYLWQLPADGAYTLRVVVHLIDGTLIEEVFAVTVEKGGATNTGEPPARTEDTADTIAGRQDSPGWLGQTLRTIWERFERIIQQTPVAVAYGIPYLFLLALSILAGVFLLQLRNQLRHTAILLALLKRDKQLADEKTTFIMLVSHYLRTPLTILGGSLDLLKNEARDAKAFAAAEVGVKQLHDKSEAILHDVEHSSFLQDIVQPDIAAVQRKLYRSWKVIIPGVLSVALLIFLNVVYLVAGRTQFSVPNIAIQIALAITTGASLVNILQRREQRRTEQRHVVKQRQHEEALDQARNAFILRASKEITPVVTGVRAACQQAIDDAKRQNVDEALARLTTMLNRFVMAAELERGKITASLTTFDLDRTISVGLQSYERQIKEKKLKISTKANSTQVTQSNFLVRYVVAALLDNAVRYSKDGGKLLGATQGTTQHKTEIIIRNQGEGIEPEKLERLFKPFTRSDNVETFNQEGIGLNLYLSRLIARYLGGDITLQSQVGKSTTATVTLPVDISRTN